MKILVAGDFVPHSRVAVQIDEGNYSCLDEVKPFVDSVDYAIVNFESPVVSHVAKPIEKKAPTFVGAKYTLVSFKDSFSLVIVLYCSIQYFLIIVGIFFT